MEKWSEVSLTLKNGTTRSEEKHLHCTQSHVRLIPGRLNADIQTVSWLRQGPHVVRSKKHVLTPNVSRKRSKHFLFKASQSKDLQATDRADKLILPVIINSALQGLQQSNTQIWQPRPQLTDSSRQPFQVILPSHVPESLSQTNIHLVKNNKVRPRVGLWAKRRHCPKEHLVWDNPLWCMICMKESREHTWREETFSSFFSMRKGSYKKTTSLIPPPSGEKWNIHSGDRKERGKGGREGCLQISAISQPDCLLTQRGHCSSFPLDGDWWGLEARGWGYVACWTKLQMRNQGYEIWSGALSCSLKIERC